MNNPRCFVSYSWDSDAHKTWVRKLAEHLQENGVTVFLDQWDLNPGSDMLSYMERSVTDSDYVLLICTPNFAQKANTISGGVGYEKMIISGAIFHRVSDTRKFVPLLRSGTPGTSLPTYLQSKVFIDFRNNANIASSLEQLLRHLYASPQVVRPPVGRKPQFRPAAGLNSSPTQPIDNTIRYCLRCGATAGSPSECIGSYMSHNFVSN